jgi:hypothetical protein
MYYLYRKFDYQRMNAFVRPSKTSDVRKLN